MFQDNNFWSESMLIFDYQVNYMAKGEKIMLKGGYGL